MGPLVEKLEYTLVSHSIKADHFYLTITGVKDLDTDKEDLCAVSTEIQVKDLPMVALTIPDEKLSRDLIASQKVSYSWAAQNAEDHELQTPVSNNIQFENRH